MSELFPPSGQPVDLDAVGSERERQRIDESVKHIAGRAASGQYRTPRDHYVFGQDELSDEQLAKAWNTSTAAIRRVRRFDEKRGFDWVKMRSEYWRRVSSQIGALLEKQTANELEDTTVQYRATVAHIISSIRDPEFIERLTLLRREGDISDFLKAINLAARTVKVCVDIEEKLTGAKLAQHIFDQQMADYDWFVEVVKAFVRDPTSLENIAKAIQTRRVTRTMVSTGEYADAIAYSRGPSYKEMEKAVDLGSSVRRLAQGAIDRQPVEVPDDSDSDLDL